MLKRSELREKNMTILYQIDLYKKNNIDYEVENVIKENVEIENEFVNVRIDRVFQDGVLGRKE